MAASPRLQRPEFSQSRLEWLATSIIFIFFFKDDLYKEGPISVPRGANGREASGALESFAWLPTSAIRLLDFKRNR